MAGCYSSSSQTMATIFECSCKETAMALLANLDGIKQEYHAGQGLFVFATCTSEPCHQRPCLRQNCIVLSEEFDAFDSDDEEHSDPTEDEHHAMFDA